MFEIASFFIISLVTSVVEKLTALFIVSDDCCKSKSRNVFFFICSSIMQELYS